MIAHDAPSFNDFFSEQQPLLNWIAQQAGVSPACWKRVRRWLVPRQVTNTPSVSLPLVFLACAFVARTGLAWKRMPPGLPPASTVFYWWQKWSRLDDCGRSAWDKAMASLALELRKSARLSAPTSLRVDSQTVRTTATAHERGFDSAKRTHGVKRTIVVDSLGLPWALRVDPGHRPERPAAAQAIARVPLPRNRIQQVVADGGYAGEAFEDAIQETFPNAELEITRRKKSSGFSLIKKRWVVERTFAWLEGFRRMDRNRERTCQSAREMLAFSLVLFMLANVG